ncbi:Hypoxanthine phosphoribosyltransferase [Candidatus Profftia lariciata]|uniref:hypoxanthine phosphoribosyltransferase n=1 Tax=Candidatus Profftia lariciata TaxID=1987921 RepID=UPI001D0292BE|nr:hypoxanthine phosphoribosyltransferase [Candidatus Profftia lariciata]UDG81249.1 Hypoxanthine phosphoribosyltransferase [Candidatus Profftia lariciata]
MQHRLEVMISAQILHQRIADLGRTISADYCHSDDKMILIGLLRGSFIFIADICRQIYLPHEVDFLTVSSYGNHMRSTRDIKILKDLEQDIYGKNVILIEDIVDSGHTLSKVYKLLSMRGPRSLAICTLLDKPSCREVNVSIKYVGFVISNEFVVGFGIDYAQHYRHLPYIGKLVIK